ncbi:MAG: pyruvate dehydrogenase complex dihydrolipoamide acetyltransferase [Parvibaculum sp.]|jgi:pyruvate dehydrogenase E2 component (dihydrolipoamide acetyltransferase)|uniref:pyruvate dehydrogenase complex dihydrolipoamide acetyltransferase n=1 Tax=Parvibaculum sp. TaxID=2024848 RepID=UPI000C656BB7|nr:pyruvate dehydrogenase complex dihydrolipoamide acetyltransferase [Parvibaculum sp.]MAU60250.1 pyruvate dehydrogenase complex dihydrolipoamide acetyltransferase [Parvibaculum sp.]|tara:strand:+ start:9003 stop:10361 length:1359 start_codon:yes stop_codon:yes gene_type:complete
MPTPVLMPALSPTMEEGTLAKWHVKKGDTVSAGDVIAEIETDKATMEVEAVDEGRIARILVEEGTEGVPVNKPIAVLLEEGESEDALEGYDPSGDAPASASSKEAGGKSEKGPAEEKNPEPKKPEPKATSTRKEPVPDTGGKAPPAPETEKGERVFASPLARRIAAQQGIDLAAISGSGPRGRIVKADIEGAPKGAAKKPAAQTSDATASGPMPSIDPRAFYDKDSYEEVPLDGMRKTIARRLTQSMQEIPHFYLTIDCELDELLVARKKLNEEAGEGVKLSVNDFLIRAAALALMKVPDANVSFAGNALLKHKSADIGIAVALDGGLITPIIRGAQKKGLAVISEEAKSLAARARDKKLKPAEYEGGSFSISNLGMFGIKHFTGVINPPQAAILAVGKGEERPVVKNGKLEIANVMTVTMSCDHRAIDGALGAQFLEAFKSFVEYPARMLL